MELKQQYRTKLTEIQNELSVLNKKFKKHKTDFEKNPNWGYTGDLDYVLSQLKQINTFLK